MSVAMNHELDWLPPGWKVEDEVKNGRNVRCFTNVESSQRLYSKDSVLRQIRNSRRNWANQQVSHSQLSNGPSTRSLSNNEIPIPTEPHDRRDRLPPGWKSKVRTRKGGVRAGQKYKIYIEPYTGYIFYSKPEVRRYLKGKAQSTGSSIRKKNAAMVDSSTKRSVRILRRQKPDQGEDVVPHSKVDEGKNVEVDPHTKSDEGKSKEVSEHPNFDEAGIKELSWDPKSDEGNREIVPLRPNLDERKKVKVPQSQNSYEGKAEEVTQDPIIDEGKKEEVSWDSNCKGKKSQASKKRKDTVKMEIAEGLPPGWIKEIRIRQTYGGVRKDSFYFNSIGAPSGYVFTSRLEVLRYLETGKLSKNVYKRRDTGTNLIQSTQESPSDMTLRSNPTEDSITRQLFTGADVDIDPIEIQKPRGNEIVAACSDTELTTTLKDIFFKKKHEDSNKATILALEDKPATSRSKNEFTGGERSKDEEETGNCSTGIREREPNRNSTKMDSSRRSSKRLAGIEIEHVTHSVAIERALRSAANRNSDKSEAEPSQKASQEEGTCHYNTESITDVFQEEQSKDREEIGTESITDVFQEEQSKDREEIGKKSSENKPATNRKKIFEGIEIDSMTTPMSSGRVLRSAIKVSTNEEAMPTLRSDQGEPAQEAPQATNVGSQEEIANPYTEPVIVPSNHELSEGEKIKDKEEIPGHSTQPATAPSNNENTSSERKPKRIRKQIVSRTEDEHLTYPMAKQRVLHSSETEAMSLSGPEQGKEAEEVPLSIKSRGKKVPSASISPAQQSENVRSRHNNMHPTRMIDFSQKTIGGKMATEPARNNFADQVFKPPKISSKKRSSSDQVFRPPKISSKKRFSTDEVFKPPKISSKKRSSTDEVTNGRGKRIKASSLSFPWSDPCIEFAYKTLTASLPRYVQPRTRTYSNSSKNNFSSEDSWPPGVSLNTVPSNNINSIAFPDPEPPGFSKGSVPLNRNDNFALPEARPPTSGNNPAFQVDPPPGFSLNDIPSDCGTNSTSPDAMPPRFSLNDTPSNCGNSFAFPDATSPGFTRNDTSSNRGSIAFLDSEPTGFSQFSFPSNRSGNLGIPAGTPPGFSQRSLPSNRNDSFALPKPGLTGFSQFSLLNKSNSFAVPATKPPGFPWSSVTSNIGDRFAPPDTRSPGPFWRSAHSNNTDHFALPDARPPGFFSSAPSNSYNDQFALPDVRQRSVSGSSAPSNINNDHFALPGFRQPGYSRSSVPSNSNDRFALPASSQPEFSWSSVPSSRNDRFALPDARPTGFSQSSIPSNNNNVNFALQDARPSGFRWSNNNPSFPNAKPPAFSWSGFQDSSINLNVAFTDDEPSGFSEKTGPSPNKQQQQDVNPAAPGTQAANFPAQGAMFSSWNRN